jgi:hypothetical protein
MMRRLTRLAILRFVTCVGGAVSAQACFDEFIDRGVEVEEYQSAECELLEEGLLDLDANAVLRLPECR